MVIPDSQNEDDNDVIQPQTENDAEEVIFGEINNESGEYI